MKKTNSYSFNRKSRNKPLVGIIGSFNQSHQSHRAASLDKRIERAEREKKYLVRADYATKNEKPPELNQHISARQSLIDQRIARLKRERSKFPDASKEQSPR